MFPNPETVPALVHGRGTALNVKNRFLENHTELDPDFLDQLMTEEDGKKIVTQFFRDHSQTIITKNDSPDIPFTYSLNPYRGCEHGCIYCYARPYHEYLGLSSGIDFESKIYIKPDAARLLQKELSHKNWTGDSIAMSGITDCYQPGEKKFEITRSCLKVLSNCLNPVGMITKNHLVTRDIDLLQKLAAYQAVHIFISITTLDDHLARIMEPRASSPQARLTAVKALSEAGIPVGVNVAPLISGLNDHEVPSIIEAAKEAGAQRVGYTVLRLPYAVKDLFTDWLEKNYPNKIEKILDHIQDIRGGKLNDARFGSRMKGEGQYAEQIKQLFKMSVEKFGLNKTPFHLSSAHFKKPGDQQMSLF